MKTAVVWLTYEYYGEGDKPEIGNVEYATIGQGGDYLTLKDFLTTLKALRRQTGYNLIIKNVVVG